MAYNYTPTYYSSLHDSITSICKNILPFSFKKKQRLPAIAAAEQRLAKQQSDNLKWQQESFHQILNLMGLCKEGILHEDEVSAFRTHLLETLIVSTVDYEPPMILRDKLIFLQELLHSKCISEDEYHASKRPLLQRLAVQGAEIGEKDVIVDPHKEISNEEWSVINLKEEKSLISRNKLKEGSTAKKKKGALSVAAFLTPDENGKSKEAHDANASDSFVGNKLVCSTENPFWIDHLNEKESESKSSIMMESLPEANVVAEKQSGSERGKRKPFKSLFLRDQKEGNDGGHGNEQVKRTWGFDGFKKWKKNNSEDETAPLSLSEKSDDANDTGKIFTSPNMEGSNTTHIKKKSHPNGSPKDLFVDEVLGENIKELSRIQTELEARIPHVHSSGDPMEDTPTQHAVYDTEPNKYFPKSWGDQRGHAALEVVRKEFKEMGNSGYTASERRNSKRWATFDDEENSHPNIFAPQDHTFSVKQERFSLSRNGRTSFNNSSIDKGFRYNPFFDM